MTKNNKFFISEIVDNYIEDDYISFHMPNHKNQSILTKNTNLLSLDFTEIEDFDNLQDPKGAIKNSLERISSIYKTKKSYILVNGSTVGILASILGVCDKNDLILINRDSHKSVLSAIELCGCSFSYIYKEKSCLGNYRDFNYENLENQINETLKTQKIKAICITSPTYEGVVSDIETLGALCKKYNIVLIVDEAHGAHLNHNKELPKSSIELGADVVVQSLHKTMPALTQTALLHICSDFAPMDNIEKYLHMLQTTSPSYIFIYSIDKLMENLNAIPFENHIQNIKKFRKTFKNSSNNDIIVVDEDFLKVKFFDITRLMIYSKKLTGKELHSILLYKYKLNFEMYTEKYVIGITSPLDEPVVYDRLLFALREIEKDYSNSSDIVYEEKQIETFDLSIKTIESEESYYLETLEKAIDKICYENIVPYPPGIPLLLKGEKITEEKHRELMLFIDKKIKIIGVYVYEKEFKIRIRR